MLAFAIGQLVHALGETLGGAAVVHEDDRGGVFLDQLGQLRVDRRPNRANMRRRLYFSRRQPVLRGIRRSPRVRHVLDRHHDLQIQRLARPRINDLASPLRPDQ
ncbi:MAG TPA: hypothetical protein VFB52_00435, partial [Solirubrobacterales bacterium]|nr:hypothetical protein [Solirubrobacterales bacterium]